ncbi:MAG: hypothetical protein H7274_21640, partial [Rhodoferax sp.]|nr:hypothetical protein [Rhodoferax sp.]
CFYAAQFAPWPDGRAAYLLELSNAPGRRPGLNPQGCLGGWITVVCIPVIVTADSGGS